MFTKWLGKNLTIQGFEKEVEYIQRIEKYYAIKNNTMEKHLKKWYKINQARMDNTVSNYYISDCIENMNL